MVPRRGGDGVIACHGERRWAEGRQLSVADAESPEAFPQPSPADRGHDVVRALLSSLPGLGGPAATLLAVVLSPPLEQRKADWFNGLAERLDRLEHTVEGLSLEKLRDDENFITAATTATLIALRNHRGEKLEALQNAVINVARETESDADLQAVFLSLVDYLTPLHMRLLRFFQDPGALGARRWQASILSSTRDIVLAALPEIPPSAYDLLCKDLENRGLISFPVTPGLGLTDERTTALGNRFLRFINEPPPP